MKEIKVISMGLSLVYIVGGAIAIKFGGDFVVDSASNIALSLGFNNISFFNKFFKQHTGITPQEYRGR